MVDRKRGWQQVKFGEVVRQVKSKADPETSGLERYVAGEHMDTDNLRIRRWGEIGDGYLGPAFHMHFKPGQVLYGSRRTYLRKVAVADFEGICANTTFVLAPVDSAKLLPDFLPFVMQTEAFHGHSKRESKGSVNPYVNFSDLAWYEFALPPLEEQSRLALLCRSTLDVEERLSTVADTHAQALTASELHVFSALACIDVPVRKLSELCTRMGVGIASSVAHAYRDSGVPIIRNTNILANRLSTDDLLFVDPAFDLQHQKKRVQAGDLVITRTATDVPGVAAVVPPELDGCQTFTTLICSPDRTVLDSEFASRWINGPQGKAFMRSRKVGGLQQNFNVALLEELPLPVPPLPDQRRIAGELRAFSAAAALIQKRLGEVRRVRQTILSSVTGHK